MPDTSFPTVIPFEQVLKALQDTETSFPPRFLNRFSDLEAGDLAQLGKIWPDLPAWRRKALLEDIEQLGQEDTIMSFEAIGLFALADSDPEVRLPAVRTLWEYENPAHIDIFFSLLDRDQSPEVRAAAASALGHYIYLGELEEIRSDRQRAIEDRLLIVMEQEQAAEVRRSALESLGYSSRDEVPALIEAAYQSEEKEWIASALFAMGRSANSAWKPQVMEMLDNPHPVIRAEAARAAGELELGAASPRLLELLDDPDDRTRLASIWSLSQLGGEGVHEALVRAYDDSEDEDDRKYIEAAIDNLTFNEDMQLLPIFDLSEMPSKVTDLAQDEYRDLLRQAYSSEFDEEFDELDEELDGKLEWYAELDELDEREDEDEENAEDFAD
jgi:HEAT repeat protein